MWKDVEKGSKIASLLFSVWMGVNSGEGDLELSGVVFDRFGKGGWTSGDVNNMRGVNEDVDGEEGEGVLCVCCVYVVCCVLCVFIEK